MKQILLFLSLVFAQSALVAQVKTAGVNYSVGAPAWTPSVNTGSELAIDTVSKRLYLWNRNTATWDIQGRGIDQTSGSTPPAYTPNQTDSYLALNNANPPELYAWTGSAWTKVGGTVQTIDTFSVSGSIVSLSLSGDAQPAKTITLPASGITALTGDVTATGPGSVAATIANGAVNGAKLASGAVSDSTKMGANVIEQSNIDNGAVWARHLARMGASTGQVLKWSGSIWGPGADNGITGSGASGQIGYWTGSGTQSGSNGLLWNNTNGVLSITKPDGLGNSIFTHYYAASNDYGLRIGDATDLVEFNFGGGRTHFTSAAGGILRLIRTASTTSGAVGQMNFFNVSDRVALVEASADGQTDSGNIIFWTKPTAGSLSARLTVKQTGNVGIGTTGPSARLHVQGAGATSSTWTAQFHNSTGTNNALMVRDDGNVGVGTASPSSKIEMSSASNQAVNNVGGLMLSTPTDATVGLQQWSPPLVLRGRGWKTDATAGSRTVDIALVAIPEQGTDLPSGGLSVRANYGNFGWNTEIIRFTPGLTQFGNSLNLRTINAAGAISTSGERYEWRAGLISTVDAYAWSFLNGNGSRSAVSGTNGFINFQESFAPTSGTGTYQFVRLRPIINQTGGASGATYGLFIDPLLTSAFDYRSIQITNSLGWALHSSGTAPSYLAGDLRIGTTTAIASAALDVTSTTKGFLPPRMTATQASAIASPAEGLMVYVTNTSATFPTKGWYGWNGAAWEKLNN